MPQPFLFVSHVSEDRAAASQIVEELERRGVHCWIAPRDVRPGRPFDDEIANAIEASQAMLLIFSERCNDSEYIRREVTVAGESHKVIIPFRIENAEPKHGLRVRLSDLHWLDAFASREQAINELMNLFPALESESATKAATSEPLQEVAPVADRRAHEQAAQPQQSAARRPWPVTPLALGIVACLILAAIGIWAYVPITSYIKLKTQTQIATTSPGPVPAPSLSPAAIAPPPFGSAACRPEAARFYDDFHKQDPGWSFIIGDQAYFADGQLVLKPKQGLTYTARYLPLHYENATICAHIKSPPEWKTLDGVSAAVIFWAANANNFYAAQIRPDGSYWISRYFGGTWITVIPRTNSAQIKTGANAVNEVAVTLVDNFGALFINNVKVQEFRGQPPLGGGAVGLHAESEATSSDEWRFLDIAVMDNGKSKTVTLPPAPSGPTIADCRPVNTTDFQDTFAKPDPGWGIGGSAAAQYADGQLLFKAAANRTQLQLYRPLVFKNATVCSTLKSPAEVGDLDSSANAGLIFWASDYQNFYDASIYPNGTFAVFRKVYNEWVTVVARTASNDIKKGLGVENELQVVLNGSNASYYINGTKVRDFIGQPPAEGGAVGLVAGSEPQQPDEWRFLGITVIENR